MNIFLFRSYLYMALKTQTNSSNRTERIMQSAADLLVRWGYKRVTIDDVAQHASIGTGTIYLHWKTKESLFETVLLRELLALWHELVQRLESDPAEALLHHFLCTLLLAIKQRPLARALFTRDSVLLGKLTRSSFAVHAQQMAGADDLIVLCRRLGLMRDDVDLATQSYAFSAVWTGFVFVDQFVPTDTAAALEMQAAALTHTIRQSFEPEILPDAETLREQVAPALLAFFRQAIDALEAQVQKRIVGT